MKIKKRHLKIIITLLISLFIIWSYQQSPDSTMSTSSSNQNHNTNKITDHSNEQATKKSTAQPIAKPGSYKVVKFIDGDTIVVDMDGHNQTIRFIGVDTPEKNDPRKPVQCFAKLASEHTKSLIGDNPVRLEADPLSDNRDRYDRLLRFVYNSSDVLVNQQIIADGYGFAVTAFPFSKMDAFHQSQINAQQNNRGLWGSCNISYPKGYPQTNPTNQ